MVRRVTLKPLNSVTKVSPTSRTMDAIEGHFSKVLHRRQTGLRIDDRKRAAKAQRAQSFSGWGDRRGLLYIALSGQRGGDLASVKAPVFYEDVRGVFTADYHPSYVNTSAIGFESFGGYLGPA